MQNLAQNVEQCEKLANNALAKIVFAEPVTHVYNPLVYAARPHNVYLERFVSHRPKALLLGMNPGPYGMVQTGVPFGEVAMVRDWLGINEPVDQPEIEHPKRPVLGFECTRSEVSGRRLWGWAQERWGSPDAFFKDCFVHNFCPLVFMAETGRNITPDKLKKDEREALYSICDDLLRQVVELIEPGAIVGVGVFAAERALKLALGVPVYRIPHPSPASPAANRGWSAMANSAFDTLPL